MSTNRSRICQIKRFTYLLSLYALLSVSNVINAALKFDKTFYLFAIIT
ncbi:hypothetical protein Y077_04285 [Salmonella enterica subsp. enterica serovar Infantis str. CVM N29304]|nr:hypothetical protein M574_22560 [Salmonella enterica subsp. enterica serovar Infantis str. 335-3]OLW61211.1 hypothetical protein Y069_16460 [Salmonella enterica subsp. enterica serovar Infantis str. CVM N15773]OLW61828.1 hypothetical protein Y070_09405 [Salmonella enterica subsp. enterica serovar Infantis str. CVM N19983]OLW71055.1 hypothetical protein Y071_18280 [Salmonella enterica subsp. enterica serovar Infantis str. CVM N20078]OLW75106.1 hypothetical protein Y072_20645 [Salmonella enter